MSGRRFSPAATDRRDRRAENYLRRGFEVSAEVSGRLFEVFREVFFKDHMVRQT